jgi:DNA-directed RNA polymerase specialized sigma54-like protein
MEENNEQEIYEDIVEFQALITDCTDRKKYETRDRLAFLTTTLIETLDRKGYSQDHVDDICERMKESFRNKRLIKGKSKRDEEIGVMASKVLEFLLTLHAEKNQEFVDINIKILSACIAMIIDPIYCECHLDDGINKIKQFKKVKKLLLEYLDLEETI